MQKMLSLSSSLSAALWAVFLAALFVGLMVVAYGMDNVAPGAHETLHDYRHANGMPCH